MPRQSPYLVELCPRERATIERRAGAYAPPYRDAMRARIVLMAAESLDNNEIALRLDSARQVVSKGDKRFFEEGLPGLDERRRRGRPASFPP